MSTAAEPAILPEPTVRVVQAAHGSADLLDAAKKRWSEGKKDEAELVFAELLSLPIPIEEKRDALLEMADLFGEADASRAIIILEKFLQTYPRDPAASSILLRLGILYRSQGAYEIASARFFRVLNATMRDGNEDLQAARQRATQARFELAEMLTEQGRITEAAAVYRKIELLDLSPEDRMTVRFRLSCVAFETRDFQAAVDSFAALRDEDPSGPYQLESAYYLAAGLKALGREREAFDVVVDLLGSQISDVSGNQAQSIYWKRRTGNELANGFYKQGDFLSALTIYQALARLSDDTEWRWPAVYQIGLCFEHLELPQRALEAYEAILKGLPVTDADLVRADASLRDLARWRSDHVKWMLDYGERFRIMVGSDTSDS
ncbi:MAG: tetratricopeptide repeat protein [Opitutaceae bacterium]